MPDDFIRRIDALIAHSEVNSHFIPFGLDSPPELKGVRGERDVIAVQFSGNIFISHSSFDEPFIRRFILPAVRNAAGIRYFFLNVQLYAARRDGKFQHALWINAALEVCKTVVLIWSDRCRSSDR